MIIKDKIYTEEEKQESRKKAQEAFRNIRKRVEESKSFFTLEEINEEIKLYRDSIK